MGEAPPTWPAPDRARTWEKSSPALFNLSSSRSRAWGCHKGTRTNQNAAGECCLKHVTVGGESLESPQHLHTFVCVTFTHIRTGEVTVSPSAWTWTPPWVLSEQHSYSFKMPGQCLIFFKNKSVLVKRKTLILYNNDEIHLLHRILLSWAHTYYRTNDYDYYELMRSSKML